MHKNKIVKKGIVFGIISLFVGAGIITSIAGTDEEKQVSIENKTSFIGFIPLRNTLYVGGTGPNNYTTIQGAIDDARNRDTVFVYNGKYNETLIINKRIKLIGENTHNTIINSRNNMSAIKINSAFVKVKGFTIYSSSGLRTAYGITISSSFCTISWCKFTNITLTGIYFIGFSRHNKIYRNIFQDFPVGLDFKNPFTSTNAIKQNNFISIDYPALSISFHNRWVRNYYDDWEGGPKIIQDYPRLFSLFNIDWFPSKIPYDI